MSVSNAYEKMLISLRWWRCSLNKWTITSEQFAGLNFWSKLRDLIGENLFLLLESIYIGYLYSYLSSSVKMQGARGACTDKEQASLEFSMLFIQVVFLILFSSCLLIVYFVGCMMLVHIELVFYICSVTHYYYKKAYFCTLSLNGRWLLKWNCVLHCVWCHDLHVYPPPIYYQRGILGCSS